MKRLLIGILTVLLLMGCTPQPTPENTEPTTPWPTGSNGMYQLESPVQVHTNHAVWAYQLPDTDYVGARLMGQTLLLVRENGDLLALSADKSAVSAMANIGQGAWDNCCFAVSQEGVSYFDAGSNKVIILNDQLRQQAEFALPGAVKESPVFSFDSKEIFYLQGKELRALDTQTNISRLVLTHQYKAASLLGAYLDGSILALQVTDLADKTRNIYLRAATGQIVWETAQPHTMQSWDDQYLLQDAESANAGWIFGTPEGQMKVLQVKDRVYGMPNLEGVVTCTLDAGCAMLDYYDLHSGAHNATVTIPAVTELISVAGDGEFVWVLGEEAGKTTLYRWDRRFSPVVDQTVYVEDIFTAENPDTQGLAECQDRADQLAKTYGVSIHLWDKANDLNGSYTVVLEHQVPTVRRMLKNLETALKKFPEGFFDDVMGKGDVQIHLVRSIGKDLTCAQYFQNGNAYILLTPQGDVYADFFQSVAYVVDSHVLGNSRDFDTWTKLNPKGFKYLYEEPDQSEDKLQPYLEGDTQAFIDLQAMKDPLEDRCRIFLYATQKGNHQYFASEAMQKKLCRVCEGIREAFKLENSDAKFLWEQYLTLEMSYKG